MSGIEEGGRLADCGIRKCVEEHGAIPENIAIPDGI